MEKEINDFFVDIVQNFNEVKSILKVLKDSLHNENNEISLDDITNTLEITVAKMHNTQISLNKFAELTETYW